MHCLLRNTTRSLVARQPLLARCMPRRRLTAMASAAATTKRPAAPTLTPRWAVSGSAGQPQPLRRAASSAAPAAAKSTAPFPASSFGLTASSTKGQGNAPASVLSKIGRNLHRIPKHPINIIKSRIESYFASAYRTADGAPLFRAFDDLSPEVTTKQNFDDLLVPPNHSSRALSDTYYLDTHRVLRTHTSAHQNDLMRAGHSAFLVTGDCYRRDEVDATHYPTFHQMEGVRVWARDGSNANIARTPIPSRRATVQPTTGPIPGAPPGYAPPAMPVGDGPAGAVVGPIDHSFVMRDLKQTLEGLVAHLFGPSTPARWIEAYFPFTEPSLELEVYFGGRWLEVLGSGAIHAKLLAHCGLHDRVGWAFGIGLERLAMVLYDIPDIRLFWSDDPRFVEQFASADTLPLGAVKFKPFSHISPVTKDVSFWVKPNATPQAPAPAAPAAASASSSASSDVTGSFHENDLHAVVRDVAGDLVESVRLQDSFVHPKTNRTSKCYRITYRHLSRSLTNAEIDTLQAQVRERLAARPDIELR